MLWLRLLLVALVAAVRVSAISPTDAACVREMVHPTPVGARWFLPGAEKIRAVAVLLHGLNLLPARMEPLAEFLKGNAVDVLRVSLTGHRGDMREFQSVRLKTWIEDTETALRLGAERAAALGVPFYVVGFSLGALMAELVLNTTADRGLRPAKVVHFAPAIAIRQRAHWVRLLGILGRSFVVPSFSPEGYGANPGTPMAAYNALFEAVRKLEQTKFRGADRETLVFIDPKDEMISYQGLLKLKEKYGLAKWKIVEIGERMPTLPKWYHHLIIDEPSLGASQWRAVLTQVAEHLTP